MKRLIIILFLLLQTINIYSFEKYVIKVKTDNAELAFYKRLSVLLAQVGVTENLGNNDSKEIRLYLDSAFYPLRFRKQPYCEALQTYANLVSGFLAYPRTALANAPYAYAKKYGRKVEYFPAIGDKIVYINKGSTTGHTETIVAILSNGNVLTVAGNVSSKSITNDAYKGGVKIMQRNIYKDLSKTLVIRGLIGFEFIAG